MSTSTGVQRIRQQQARELQAKTGMPYAAALRQITQPTDEASTPPPRAKAFATAENAPWKLLWGHRVSFADPRCEGEGKVPHHFLALVLPPAPGSRAKPWRLRVLPTGRQEPIIVDGRRWKLSPDPFNVDTARYDFDKGPTPPTALMTRNMLRKRLRTEPAKGQQAAGVLDYKHGPTVELYYTGDTVPLPELKGKHATAWQRNRTCADCGKYRDLPWELLGATGLRVCPACRDGRALRTWREAKLAFVEQVRSWAAGVLADPAAALTVYETGYQRPTRVRLVDLTGAVLFTSDAMQPPQRSWSDAEEAYVCADADLEREWAQAYGELCDAVRGRRLIGLSEGYRYQPEEWWTTTIEDLGLEPLPGTIAKQDWMNRYAVGWLAEPTHRDHYSLLRGLQQFDLDNGHPAWPRQALQDRSPDGLIANARNLLAAMATGTAPGIDEAPSSEETAQ